MDLAYRIIVNAVFSEVLLARGVLIELFSKGVASRVVWQYIIKLVEDDEDGLWWTMVK